MKDGRGGSRAGAGRPTGKSAKTLAFAEVLRKKLEKKGLDVWSAFANIALDKEETTQNRLTALKELAPYMQAKLTHITHAGDQDNPLVVQALEGRLNESLQRRNEARSNGHVSTTSNSH